MTFLSIDDVSTLTGLSRSTLAKRRCDGTGPAFFKLGRAVKYDRADLDAWIASRRRTSTWIANANATSIGGGGLRRRPR
ncbi:helix-turn-helix transcriptional regulator [Bradyrhizobium sp.]|uniref:helix-turn-helix transcriptional regulator n=1 Tax=Bradyrhizobium sp. TaxID=376 RepID=UPI0039E5A3DA